MRIGFTHKPLVSIYILHFAATACLLVRQEYHSPGLLFPPDKGIFSHTSMWELPTL